MLVQNILNYIEQHDLKVSEFARKCGLKQSTISGIINGYTKSPTLEVVTKIADGMGVTIDELTKNNKRANDEVQKIYNSMKDLDEKEKALVYAMILSATKTIKEFRDE